MNNSGFSQVNQYMLIPEDMSSITKDELQHDILGTATNDLDDLISYFKQKEPALAPFNQLNAEMVHMSDPSMARFINEYLHKGNAESENAVFRTLYFAFKQIPEIAREPEKFPQMIDSLRLSIITVWHASMFASRYACDLNTMAVSVNMQMVHTMLHWHEQEAPRYSPDTDSYWDALVLATFYIDNGAPIEIGKQYNDESQLTNAKRFMNWVAMKEDMSTLVAIINEHKTVNPDVLEELSGKNI